MHSIQTRSPHQRLTSKVPATCCCIDQEKLTGNRGLYVLAGPKCAHTQHSCCDNWTLNRSTMLDNDQGLKSYCDNQPLS